MEQQGSGEGSEQGILNFRPAFDADLQKRTENELMLLIGALNDWYSRYGLEWCNDPDVVSRVKAVMEPIIILYTKRGRDPANIDSYAKDLMNYRSLPTLDTINKLRTIEREFIQIIGREEGFTDKHKKKLPWDAQVRKKLHMAELPPEHQLYFDSIVQPWKKFIFEATAHMVLNDGDVQMLMTGINNGGKTHTSLCMLQYANLLLREYWKVSWKNNGMIFTEIPKFSLSTNVIYIPDPGSLEKMLENTQYNCVDINEGLAYANNLESMNRNVIRAGINPYLTKSHHNFIIYEYQVAKRPTGLLMERFNFWCHKMSPKYVVLSMPSGLHRKTDPLYLKELDKLKTDEEISDWFVYQNPNYITYFKAPKLKPKVYRQFQKYQAEAHETMKTANEIKGSLSDATYMKVKEIWNKLNIENTMAWIDVPIYLDEIGLNEAQKRTFMRKLNSYDALMKFNRGGKQLEVIENG